MSNCFKFHLFIEAIAMVILKLSDCAVGEYVEIKSSPTFC